MSLITIEQLLESVDLDFDPRWVTKDENGTISFHGDETKPRKLDTCWAVKDYYYEFDGCLKVAEFTNKPWQECIYEVPRKESEIERLETDADYMQLSSTSMTRNQDVADTIMAKINELIDAVNELKAKGE